MNILGFVVGVFLSLNVVGLDEPQASIEIHSSPIFRVESAFFSFSGNIITKHSDGSYKKWAFNGPILNEYKTVSIRPRDNDRFRFILHKDFSIEAVHYRNKKKNVRLMGHGSHDVTIKYVKSKRMFISFGDDKKIKTWERATGSIIGVFDIAASVNMLAADISPQGNGLLITLKNGSIYLVRIPKEILERKQDVPDYSWRSFIELFWISVMTARL